jgi:O-antigen biosynthesis protein
MKKSIAYIVPGLSISGGIAVILQHVNRLIDRGYGATLVNVGDPVDEIPWFHNKARIINVRNSAVPDHFDIAVATLYNTVKFVKNLNSDRKIYFVQSDERRFFPENIQEISECEMSYRENIEFMTEAIWIQRWLKEEFGHDAYYVPNGLDDAIISKTDPLLKKGGKARVLLEGPISLPRKGMEDAYRSVKDLDCEIWIVSGDGKPEPDWRCDQFYEQVPLYKMKEIYSSWEIFLKMSRVEGFFGPPMEAMACGCSVVVGKVTGYDEYIKNGVNALVVGQGDVAGAKKAVEKLIYDSRLREKLIRNGHSTARRWGWNRSIDLLEKAVNRKAVTKYYTNKFPEKYDYGKTMQDIYSNLSAKGYGGQVEELKSKWNFNNRETARHGFNPGLKILRMIKKIA